MIDRRPIHIRRMPTATLPMRWRGSSALARPSDWTACRFAGFVSEGDNKKGFR